MKYLSVCSGIEAATNAWHDLGWEPVAFSEIDPFASAVLAARFPNVPNLGDMEKYREWNIEPGSVDVVVGGTPCQSFSVAGLRKGLDDPRGNLALVYLGLVDRLRPRYVVWENVPGVLSVDGGRAFGSFLGGLAQLGYGWAYRVMDAQYVRVESHPRAVPQRRRRVFVVGCARGDWQRAATILLEPEGVLGNSAPRREAGKEAPRGARPGAAGGGVSRGVAFSFDPGQSHNPKATHQFCVEHTAPLIKERVHAIGKTAEHYVAAVGHDVASCIGASGRGFARTGETRGQDPVVAVAAVGNTLTRRMYKGPNTTLDECQTLIPSTVAFQWPVDVADPITAVEGRTYTHEGTTFRTHNVVPDVIGFASNLGSQGGDVYEGKSPTLRVNSAAGVAHSAVAVNVEHALHESGNFDLRDVVQPLTRSEHKGHTVVLSQAVAFKASHFTRGKDGAPSEIVPPLSADADKGDQDTLVAAVSTGRGWWSESGVGATVRAQESPNKADTLLAAATMAVRRLTPRECERLQGFPDDWTAIAYRGKPAADGPRYKALGNSMAVNVMRWIGERIAMQLPCASCGDPVNVVFYQSPVRRDECTPCFDRRTGRRFAPAAPVAEKIEEEDMGKRDLKAETEEMGFVYESARGMALDTPEEVAEFQAMLEELRERKQGLIDALNAFETAEDAILDALDAARRAS